MQREFLKNIFWKEIFLTHDNKFNLQNEWPEINL